MDDLRQKLFPIFLQEADRNLAALRHFLAYEDLSVASADDLETAFRAAHTLKGTANLVQAESICKIARRLEAMLEKHFEARTRPTPVEHEALMLAVDWLAPLVSALQGDLQEPKLFVAEALQALDLAEAFPGRTPLIELLDSHTEQRSPLLDDPFASDPDFLPEEAAILHTEKDPFAEDPAFGMEIDLVAPGADVELSENLEEEPIDDPFAADCDFSAEELPVVKIEDNEASPVEGSAEELPYDPFAEDSLGLDVDSITESASSVDVIDTERMDEEEGIDPSTSTAGDNPEISSEPVIVDDPFAEDEDFVDGLATVDAAEEDSDPFARTAAAAAMRAEEIAESLLLPQDAAVRRSEYVCCVFAIGGRDYHLPIKQMQEISDIPQMLPLPLAPPMVSGLINLRGQVMPVINLAKLNQHQQSEVRVQRRLVISEYRNEKVAFLVDGVPYLSEEFTGEKIDMSQFLSLYRLRGVE